MASNVRDGRIGESEMKEKLANVFKRIFAVCQSLLLVASLVTVLAYIAAFIIGGETAVLIDSIVYNKVFPIMFFLAVAFAFVGVVYLYLMGYRTFRFETKKKD